MPCTVIHFLFDCIHLHSDIDECANNDGMEKAMCTNGRCQNTARGYVCVCDPGFRSDSTRKSCKGERSFRMLCVLGLF